jgi:hypothetical protein
VFHRIVVLVFVIDCVVAKRRITNSSICCTRQNQRALSHVFNKLVELLEQRSGLNRLIVEDMVWHVAISEELCVVGMFHVRPAVYVTARYG